MKQPSQCPSSNRTRESDICFPAETDIFILPDGSVVIADLPQELEELRYLLTVCAADEPAGPASSTGS